jgi:hypothetical protein
MPSLTGKPKVTKVEPSSRDRMSQEANAVSRKASGNHNATDRAKCLTRKGADVGQVMA